MTTLRQIERYWLAKEYVKLFRELAAARPEGRFEFETEIRAPLAAALAVIRLDELVQSHAPLYARLLRSLLLSQESDGGWGDPVTTALCLRALLCGEGNGLAVERGMTYLANLQKDEGIWPSLPLRRMPADAAASAFILSQLGDSPVFRQAVRLDAAAVWFECHASELDEQAAALWARASLRCRIYPVHQALADPFWASVA